ncbi:phosphopantetheine-binding protein, partial [Protofrankia coriariae]
MVPDAFVVLDALPLTPNGKLDRDALPAPAVHRAPVRGPRDDRERTLCEIFAAVLRVDQVGVDEDFFALGGDSILSIAVASRARREGMEISARDVFAHRTPAALAAFVGPSGTSTGAGPADGGEPDDPAAA